MAEAEEKVYTFTGDCTSEVSDDTIDVPLTDSEISQLHDHELDDVIIQFKDIVKKLTTEKKKRTNKLKKVQVAQQTAQNAVDSDESEKSEEIEVLDSISTTAIKKTGGTRCVATCADMKIALTKNGHGDDFKSNDKKDALLAKIIKYRLVTEANAVYAERKQK